MTRAAIYIRISEDVEGEGQGVARQLADCQALCERKGWEVVDVYSDNDTSAYSKKPRKHYGRMLDDTKNGALDVIVAWHPDRLHRPNLRDLEDFIDLLELTSVTVATVTAGDRDFATADGRFMARIEATIARRESEHKSERIRRKHKELAKGGRAVSGRRPFGHEWVAVGDKKHAKLRVVPAEAKLVRQAVGRVLAGDSLYAIVNDWNERGIASVTGAPWNTKTLKQILVSGRIAGFRDFHGEHIESDQWKPLVDVADWEAVRVILIDQAQRRTRVPRSYLLGGLLRCAVCGGKLVATPRRNPAGELIPRYGCRKYDLGGCGRVSIPAEPLEVIVSDAVVKRLSDPDFVARLGGGAAGDDTEMYRAEVAELEASLEEASRDFYVDHVITKPEFMAARKGIVPKLDWAKKALAAATRHRPTALLTDLDNLEADWPKLGLDRQRALIEACVESVEIMLPTRSREPAEAFDATRVGETIWRV